MVAITSHQSESEEEWDCQAFMAIIEEIILPSSDIAGCNTSRRFDEGAKVDEEIALTAISDIEVISYY